MATSASASGDLGLGASVPDPVMTGVASTYTITLTDNSSLAIQNVTAGVQLPADMSLKNTGGECVKTNRPTLVGTAFSCAFPNLAPGGTDVGTFSTVASSPGTDTIGISASGAEPSPTDPGVFFAAGSTVNMPVSISPGPTDIQVTGSSNNGSPPVGSQFSYTFQVKDNGPQAAYGVTFDDTLPGSLSLGGVSTNDGTCGAGSSPGSVHCDIGLLGVGQQSNIVITATPTATGIVTDTASIAMANPDTHLANNSVSVIIQPK